MNVGTQAIPIPSPLPIPVAFSSFTGRLKVSLLQSLGCIDEDNEKKPIFLCKDKPQASLSDTYIECSIP